MDDQGFAGGAALVRAGSRIGAGTLAENVAGRPATEATKIVKRYPHVQDASTHRTQYNRAHTCRVRLGPCSGS